MVLPWLASWSTWSFKEGFLLDKIGLLLARRIRKGTDFVEATTNSCCIIENFWGLKCYDQSRAFCLTREVKCNLSQLEKHSIWFHGNVWFYVFLFFFPSSFSFFPLVCSYYFSHYLNCKIFLSVTNPYLFFLVNPFPPA